MQPILTVLVAGVHSPAGDLSANSRVRLALTLLLILMFSRFVYLASLNSYFTFT